MSRILVSVLVVAFACINMVQASISPMSLSANMNSLAPNVFVASFYQQGQAANPMSIQALLPLPFDKVENLSCTFEVLSQKRPTDIPRTYPINVSVGPSYNDSTVAAFSGAVNIAETRDLGYFDFICTFFLSTDRNLVNGQGIVYAWNVYDSSTVLGSSQIRPFASFTDYISTTLAYPESSDPSVFIITKPNNEAYQVNMKLTNTARTIGTTAAATIFTPARGVSYCDVTWDGVNYPNSVTATILYDGTEVTFMFGSPINAARELVVTCPEVKAYTSSADRSRPSLLTYTVGRSQGFSIAARVMGEKGATDE